MTKVAVLTDFTYLLSSYGLVPVVLAWLDTLLPSQVIQTVQTD